MEGPGEADAVVLGASITGLIVLFVIHLVTPGDVVVASLYVLPIVLAAAVLTRRSDP